jgi:hypothetical protein
VVTQSRTSQEQVNDIVAFAGLVMCGAFMVGMVRSMLTSVSEHGGSPESRVPLLMPAAVPELAPIDELAKRLAIVSEELGPMSLVELVGWTRTDRLVRKAFRAMKEDWSIAPSEMRSLESNPLGTVEGWLQPGGLVHDFPALQEVAQIVIEAAEAKVERGRQALPQEAIDDINYRISQRTSYGLREEVAPSPGVIIVWSNSSADWYATRPVRKGERLTLDANQVFVPYPRRRVEAVLHKLEPLPLYKYSYEAVAKKKESAKRLGAEARMESDERWLEGLRKLGLAVYAGEGYTGAAPVPLIADVPGLEHIGGGNLSDGRKIYRLRINPETGTRFYVAEELPLRI